MIRRPKEGISKTKRQARWFLSNFSVLLVKNGCNRILCQALWPSAFVAELLPENEGKAAL
jgi:hypothetical protein